ncbi:hypothetical protein FSARC_14704 [Fusarium sarcochroum]|uniref:NACHT domain-containing protein n=1 Tax=Fusarium sarcochroum TaxID=1208366 RepID=A0A8H4WNQ1_9HYPO|nr:hypothetical protein FSARC_14704 [Fusarium sarcochroum]
MATIPTSDSPVLRDLLLAQENFRKKLRSPEIYNEILTATTISQVYKATHEIQEKILAAGALRGLGKIAPFLERLSTYAAAIEVFVSVKPDLLGLIWGPIKIILLWSSQLGTALDKVADLLEAVGHTFPQFATLSETFPASDVIQAAATLFYEDLLELYVVLFEFFRKPSWKQFFDVIWIKYQKRLDLVLTNFEKHSVLMRHEATILDIKEAREARLRASEFFVRAEASQELQKYSCLKCRISPSLYDDRLDSIRNRCIPNCAAWLLNDEIFNNWLDADKSTVTWLWLRGLPGAGKTYLSATVIDHARDYFQAKAFEHSSDHCRVFFVFVSHNTPNNLTALSVLQSLAFQAAEDNQDFQSILVASNERQLRGHTGYVTDLLQAYLATIGPGCLIIDGLDEMEPFERKILLQKLESLSNDCMKLRFLISSRAEDDILKSMEQKARTIRIEHRNAGSIQQYVDHRCRDWMAREQFDRYARTEVLQVTASLSAKAEGMFLYARIILDDLEQMSSIEEIRQELRALPNDLTDAYHRIFVRINNQKAPLREKCRKVLGWIGCAPVPLTTFEMEQALSVDLSAVKERNGLPQLFLPINFVLLCGPIIEIVDDKVQFVHFTVHEYMFSKEIPDFIDRAMAIKSLTIYTLGYLALTIADQDLDEDDFQRSILHGRYRFFNYAYSFWPTLLHQLNEHKTSSTRVNWLLHTMLLDGRNYDFDNATNYSKSLPRGNVLQDNPSDVLTMVNQSFQFHSDDKRWDWELKSADSWVNMDPLTGSKMLVRIQEEHESLLLDSLYLAALQSHYGAHLFRCPYAFCKQSFRGFATKGERDLHLDNHGNPWKCSIISCDFSTIGFSSKTRCEAHLLNVHRPTAEQIQAGPEDYEHLRMVDIQPVLFQLILEGHTESISRLLSSSNGKRLEPEVLTSARVIAAKEGSLIMTQLLTPEGENTMPARVVKSAIESEDIKLAQMAISRVRREDCSKMIASALSTKVEEIYALWADHLANMPPRVVTASGRSSKNLFQQIFSAKYFRDIQGDSKKEIRTRELLRKLENVLNQEELGSILLSVAKSSCSVEIALELIGLGAPHHSGSIIIDDLPYS